MITDGCRYCLGTMEKYGRLAKGVWFVNWQGEVCRIVSCDRQKPGYYFATWLVSPTQGEIGVTLSHMSRVWRQSGFVDACAETWAGAGDWLGVAMRSPEIAQGNR